MKKHTLASCVLAALLPSMNASAWQIDLADNGQGQFNQVVVSSERNIQNRDVYLIWVDLDAQNEQNVVASWTADNGWQRGALSPILPQALDLPPFDAIPLTVNNEICPEEHRCFLAMLALPAGVNPLELEQWEASSLLPLTPAAGRERLPGQRFFLANDRTVRFNDGFSGGDVLSPTLADDADGAPAPSSPESGDANNGDSPTVTEKPDIFRLNGTELLYANGQAKRFQIIDVSDPANPTLQASVKLDGFPRELYQLNDLFILLQTGDNADEGTQISVFQQQTDGSLTQVHDTALSGRFVESRRRNDIIYSVSQNINFVPFTDATLDIACFDCGSQEGLIVKALRVEADGSLTEVAEQELSGYSPTVAIFSDYLMVVKPDPQQWPDTQIQAFELTDPNNPMVALPELNVPGRIPSEFHVDVRDDKLRVVYGPENRTDGSTLAIFNLPDMTPVGEVSDIAPGEALFATRFAGDQAFVVTFERTDPLWVIDLSNPASPQILGELHVPGWSEKLFFHEDRLFGVGIHDQPEPNEPEERRVSRVALSLFDVSDPTNPDIFNRFIPLKDRVRWSYTPALQDERALLLDWNREFAALPIESWESNVGSHLQIVTFGGDLIADAGLLESPVSLQRSVSLTDTVLAGLADQALLTLRWGSGDAELLAELELARNLRWVEVQGDNLLAAGLGNNGYHRLYEHAPADLDNETRDWQLPRGYQGVKVDEDMAVFYNLNPLAVQVVNLTSGEVQPAQILDNIDPDSASLIATDAIWFNRSQPLVKGGQIHVAEQRAYRHSPIFRETGDVFEVPQWTLRSWPLTGGEPVERSIPGMPLGFTKDGQLIVQEFGPSGETRLNLLALTADSATLVATRVLPCESYSSQPYWDNETLYLSCLTRTALPEGPIPVEPDGGIGDGAGAPGGEPIPVEPDGGIGDGAGALGDEPIPVEADGGIGDGAGAPGDDRIPVEPDGGIGITADIFAPQPTGYTLYRLDPTQSFADIGSWQLEGYADVRAIADDVVVLFSGGYYIAEPALVDSSIALPPGGFQNSCGVYRMTPNAEPVLLQALENCPYGDTIALTPEELWMALGFEGIQHVDF